MDQLARLVSQWRPSVKGGEVLVLELGLRLGFGGNRAS